MPAPTHQHAGAGAGGRRHRPGRRAGLALVLAAAAVGTAGGAGALLAPVAASAATASTLTATGGSPQSATAGSTFVAPLTVSLECGGSPVVGATLTFSAPAGGATATFPVTGATTASVTTGPAGTASIAAVAGSTPGTYSVLAVVASMNGSSCGAPAGPVSFTLTNTAAVPSRVLAVSGSPQSAAVGTAFAEPLQAEVVDAAGQPVAGATVVFAVQASAGAGATFATGGANATAQTASSGIATSPVLTAGTTPGAFTATATVQGVAAYATFDLTDLAGSPATVTAGVGASQQVPAGSTFPVRLAVTVTDADRNPVAGVTVTFAAPATGPGGTFAGSGATATAVTDASGIAVAPAFTADGTVGGYVVTASVAGVATPAVFELVNQVPGPAGTGGGAAGSGAAGSGGGGGGGAGAGPGTPAGAYRMVAADGAVFAFGGAPYLGGQIRNACEYVPLVLILNAVMVSWFIILQNAWDVNHV